MLTKVDNEIAISILNANFLELKKLLDFILENKLVKRLHYDVMDYDFVPNLSFGPHILSNIKKYVKNKILIDCHMMVKIKGMQVYDYLKPFLDIKPDIITMHFESLNDSQIEEFLLIRKNFHQKIGLAISPDTKVKSILHLLNKIDLILVMSVKPGFGGQDFILNTQNKITEIHEYILLNNLNILIEVDGGINLETISLCKKANIVVIGNYLATVDNEDEFTKKVNNLYGK